MDSQPIEVYIYIYTLPGEQRCAGWETSPIFEYQVYLLAMTCSYLNLRSLHLHLHIPAKIQQRNHANFRIKPAWVAQVQNAQGGAIELSQQGLTPEIWVFPKIVGFPPKSSILKGFPWFSPSILEYPLLLETPIWFRWCSFSKRRFSGVFFVSVLGSKCRLSGIQEERGRRMTEQEQELLNNNKQN